MKSLHVNIFDFDLQQLQLHSPRAFILHIRKIMKFNPPSSGDLQNESDVEQKLIYPLLIGEEPYGLGIIPSIIQTKRNIRRFPIGKGADRKVYFPDYLVVQGGLPLLVIEAKTPGENLIEALGKQDSTQAN